MVKLKKIFNKFLKSKKSHHDEVKPKESFHDEVKPKKANVSNRFTIFFYDERSVTSDEEQGGNILNLPDEMLLAIFNFLSLRDLRECALVCKRFRKFSFDSILGRRISLINTTINIISLERILNCGVRSFYLENIYVSKEMTWIPPFFESKRFQSLQHLHIFKTRINSDLLENLLTLTPQLKSIKLCDTYETIGKDTLKILLNLKFLESLDVTGSLEIDHDILDIFQIDRTYTNLRYFRLITNEDAEDVLILKKCLENLFKLSPNIVSLDIDENIEVEEDTSKHILNMKYIKYLAVAINLSAVYNMNNKFLCNHDVLYNLWKINLSGINFRILVQFFERAPNLELIRLEDCFIPETAFIQMMNLKHLQHLECRTCSFDLFTEALRNFESLRIPLRTVDFSSCDGLSSGLLSTLLLSCSYLHTFHISYVNVNWVTFKNLLASKYLENLKMYNVKVQLQDWDYIDLMGYNFSQLKILHLESVEISEIEHCFAFCSNMTSLLLEDCVITLYLIQCVIHMKNLVELYFCSVEQDSYGNISNSHHEVLCKLTDFCFTHRRTRLHYRPSFLEFLFPAIKCARNVTLGEVFIPYAMYRCIHKMKELNSLTLFHVFGVFPENIPLILRTCPKLRKDSIMITNF